MKCILHALPKTIPQKGRFFLCAAWFAFAVVLVAYYILVSMPSELHADFTDTILWAQAAHDAKGILNPDFRYACFLPFGGQLLMLPLIGVFGYSMTTHCVGMLLFALLLAGALLFLLRGMRFGWNWSLFIAATTLLLLCASSKLREIFFGHVIYYSLGCLFFCTGAGLHFRALRAEGRRARIVTVILVFAFSLVSALNGMMTMALYNVPFLAAVLLERLLEQRPAPRENRRILCVALICVAGMLIGYGVGKAISAGMVAEYADSYSRLSKMEEWAGNLRRIFPAWMQLNDPIVFNGYDLLSGNGLASCVCIATSLLLLAVPILGIVRYRSFETDAERVVILFHTCLSLLLLFLLIFGRLSDMYWRLSPLAFTSALASLVTLRMLLTQPRANGQNIVWRRMAAFAMLPLTLACLINARRVVWLPNDDAATPQRACIEFLRANGLDYGYATFWNAAPITLASDNDVRVRGVLLDAGVEGGLAPDLYQTNVHWYEDVPGQTQYFLLLTEQELAQLEACPGNPVQSAARRLTFPSYVVLVYDHNLF